MAFDSRELQLAAARQRFHALSRRAAGTREQSTLLAKTLSELDRALEEVRVAQEQLIETRHRLEAVHEELRREHQRYWQLFDQMPDAYVVSRTDSTILEVNKAAAQLLNVSQRFLAGKSLSVFVCENREAFLAAVTRAGASGEPLELSLKLRPRERAPLTVQARVTGDKDGLRWVLRPSGPAATPHDGQL